MNSERRTGSIVAIGILLLVFGVGLVLSVRMLASGGLAGFGDRVAVVPLNGVILGEDGFLRRLDSFRRDAGIRAFVIEIESPGGTVGASQSIYAAIRDLREEEDRPVVAWLGDVGASGGYYAALGADSVFALPGTLTGSIGVIMEFPNVEGLFRDVGVGWEIVKSGEYKDMGNISRSLTEADRRILEGVVSDVHGQFIDAVAANRPLDRSRVEALADGRIYSGRQALELGLVDRLGTLDEAVAAAGRMAGLGDRPRVERPPEPRLSLWDLVLGLFDAEARGLLRTLVPTHSGTPRLLYEWR